MLSNFFDLYCIYTVQVKSLKTPTYSKCAKRSKAKGGYFEESKIDFDLLNTFLVTTQFHVIFHSFDIFNSIYKNKKPLNE
jgi:hypothetical protein